MKKIQIMLLAMIVTSPAYARLGETLAECDARYEGQMSKGMVWRDAFQKNYQSHGIRVIVRLPDGDENSKVFDIDYRRSDSIDPETPWAEKLLEANAQGFEWKEEQVLISPFFPKAQQNIPNSQKPLRKWTRSDGEAFAELHKNYMLKIKTKASLEFEQLKLKEKRENTSQSLDGM